jgi:glutamate N-acetyltransferase / amino-acid N-acetyltransferase
MSVTAPKGFRAAGIACGIKASGLDLALVAADGPCAAAAMFTTNRAQAAPVIVSREHMASGRARAIVANAGCANAATGAAGLADAREMAVITARGLGISAEEVVVASTGVIGVALPMEKLRTGIPRAAEGLTTEGGAAAARAIMTTDTRPKEVKVDVGLSGRTACIGAMAKGAGMIAPRMATMLAFFTTDAAMSAALLGRALAEAVGDSLNRITVDGDTSTNDMAVLLANGAAGAPPIASDGEDYRTFVEGLTNAARGLAEMLVRDGEGATRIAEVRIEGAPSGDAADRIARTIAESPLVKTALHGGDPNWGRILAAVGRAGVDIDASGVDLWIGDVWVAEGGQARGYEERAAAEAMREDPVRLRVRLRQGSASSWMWTTDLTHGYVDINAHYRS